MKFNQLANIIGQDAALKLAVAWGGERVSVPRPDGQLVADFIIKQFRIGRDPCCIAAQLSLRTRQVRKILRNAGIDCPEPDPVHYGRVRP